MSWHHAHIITFSYFCLVFVRHCEMLWKRIWIFFNSSGERCFSNFFQGTVDSLNINFCILPIRSWRLEKRHSLGGKHFWRLKTALKYQLAASERPWPPFGSFWTCVALTSSLIVSHSVQRQAFFFACPALSAAGVLTSRRLMKPKIWIKKVGELFVAFGILESCGCPSENSMVYRHLPPTCSLWEDGTDATRARV